MNLQSLTSVFNYRMTLILIETIVIYFLYDYYQIRFQLDFTIMSVAIVFPLVFSITSAYQRRQDSIQEFSIFRNKIIDLSNIFYSVNETKKEDYKKLFSSLLVLQNLFIDYLKNPLSENDYKDVRLKRKEVFLILDSYKNFYNEREKDSLIRVKNELFQSAEKLRGIKIHATPISLRKYCLVFIYLSPFLFNTQLIVEKTSFGFGLESIISLSISVVVSFILIALYNVQDYIENPFDQEGLDDLKISEMDVSNYESLNE
jgi:predicted membrane chloride channel (bestrophin family)|tara:strand:- start:1880 stop:2656 length:777 start_codon:yes stop_codon:yes gene_type:complete